MNSLDQNLVQKDETVMSVLTLTFEDTVKD